MKADAADGRAVFMFGPTMVYPYTGTDFPKRYGVPCFNQPFWIRAAWSRSPFWGFRALSL